MRTRFLIEGKHFTPAFEQIWQVALTGTFFQPAASFIRQGELLVSSIVLGHLVIIGHPCAATGFRVGRATPGSLPAVSRSRRAGNSFKYLSEQIQQLPKWIECKTHGVRLKPRSGL